MEFSDLSLSISIVYRFAFSNIGVCISGVPKLKRSELEAACEDFSNIIGTFSDGTVYKGTLSSGVEIAVTSTAVSSREDWSKNLETQFTKKVLQYHRSL